MTSNPSPAASIIKGLPFVGLLFLGALAGCSSGSPSETGTDSTGDIQQDLRLPHLCGGPSMRECGDDQVCLPIFSKQCPGPKQFGFCAPRPNHCPQVSDPVCGCDGNTYSNLCNAAEAGTALEHRGACGAAVACGEHSNSSCPGAGSCVDDPSGSCDSDDDDHHQGWFWNNGFGHHDHDCAKVCECKVTQSCPSGQQFNDSPSVCACEASHDPCAGVTCKAGEQCVAQSDGTGACEPTADPCAGVTCKAGEVCVAGLCETDPCAGISCKAGQTCVVQSDGTALCQ